ncbi:MAG TPA: tetratricopeptide repeat protein [Bacteroidia bacterium]|jgi:tetratricopeptide (TPR) repeat protein
MKSVNKKQIFVIAGSLILIVLLLLANTKLPEKAKAPLSDHAGHDHDGSSMNTLVESAKEKLSTSQKQAVVKLEDELKSSPDKKTAYQNMIGMWDSLRQPVIAAHYMEQAAIASPNEKNWMEAGNRYYGSTRFAPETERPMLYSKAIECYEKTVQLNPANTEAKINLGACYVEGSAEPMKGIGLLKEVEKTDSNNVNLQLNFAFFSEKSGQWDKAIARFEKVLKIQPDFIEAYLHLADAYEQKGDKANAIKSLEKYRNLVEDATIKTEVQDYINKLSAQDFPKENK